MVTQVLLVAILKIKENCFKIIPHISSNKYSYLRRRKKIHLYEQFE